MTVLAYGGVFLAAAIEGEGILIAASVLAGLGQLDTGAVVLAGALGGSAGDQFWFLALRGRFHAWLERFPAVTRRRDAIASRVRRHHIAMILACRFLPGLRIAIPAACAYAGVPRVRFAALSLASSFAWATTVVFTVATWGPRALEPLGISGPAAMLLPATVIVGFFWWLTRASERSICS